MSEFDRSGYEDAQGREFARVAERLQAMSEFAGALDQYGQGPRVMLLCGRGHRLLPVFTDLDHNGHLLLLVSPDHYTRADQYVATPNEPWRTRSSVCTEPGCPAIISYIGWCEAHGARRLNTLGNVRTEFYCRANGCKPEQVTTARLLAIYGMALTLGRSEVPVTTNTPR